MATDATGTPTSPDGLAKINPSVDAPSGVGQNSLADSIQTALTNNYARKPAGIVSGEAMVWNGTGWDRSSVTRIGATSLGSGTPDATKYLRGDGSWQVISAGPSPATSLPGSPANGDLTALTDSLTAPTYMWPLRYNSTAAKWYPFGAGYGYGTSLPTVASPADKVTFTLVDSITLPTYQWTFMWNAGSSNTDKWEFIGGPPAVTSVATSESYNSSTFVDCTTVQSITLTRGGRYIVATGALHTAFDPGGVNLTGVKVGAAAAVDHSRHQGASAVSQYAESIITVAANDVIKLQFRGNSGGGTSTVQDRMMRITPVRVS